MLLVLLSWLSAALIFGHFQLARGLPFWAPPLIPLLATAFFSILAINVAALRNFALTINMSWLVSIAFLRGMSVYIAYLAVKGDLPMSFAIPIETGVAFVLIGAVFLIGFAQPLESRGRRWLVVWNVFGFLQVLSILATVAWHIAIGQPPKNFSSLPLNLFPTLIVPLSLVGHILIAYRLMRGERTVQA